MKKILSLSLVFVLVLSAFVLASCKGTNDKDAQNTAPPHSAASETAAPTDTPTAAPETEAPTADPNPRPDPVTVEWLAGEMQRRYYVGCMNLELMDFSDIMDRNEDTDLFFWDNQLEIDLKKLGRGYNRRSRHVLLPRCLTSRSAVRPAPCRTVFGVLLKAEIGHDD